MFRPAGNRARISLTERGARQDERIEQHQERAVGRHRLAHAAEGASRQSLIEADHLLVDRLADLVAELDDQAAIAGVQEARLRRHFLIGRWHRQQGRSSRRHTRRMPHLAPPWQCTILGAMAGAKRERYRQKHVYHQSFMLMDGGIVGVSKKEATGHKSSTCIPLVYHQSFDCRPSVGRSVGRLEWCLKRRAVALDPAA